MREKRIAYAGIIIIVILIICDTLRRNEKEKKLRQNLVFSNGSITKFLKISKSYNADMHYVFHVNNLAYTGNKVYSNIDKFNGANAFIGKTFLVVYSKKDTNNNQILITKEDYEKFGLLYPDSLKWVEKYFWD